MSDKYKHYTREDLEDAIDRLREDILIQTQKVITLRAALKRLHDAAAEATEDLLFGEWWKEELDEASAALKETE